MTRTIIPADLKPYLRYSAALHAAIAIWLAIVLARSQDRSSQVYTIDIVGPVASEAQSQSVAQASASKAEPAMRAPSGHMEERKSAKDFSRRRRRVSLPAPSLLEGYQNVSARQAPQAAAPPPAPQRAAAGAGAPGSVSFDLSDFPYPWYISQVRMALWSQWSSRMPGGGGSCVVEFSILPDGRITDLRTEESSGDSGFDLTALGAIQDAAPFPPLPTGYKKPFLTIHLTLTSS